MMYIAIMQLYNTKQVAKLLGQNWQTISGHCHDLQDNDHIRLQFGRYLIDQTGLNMIKKFLSPVGWKKGKKRAK
jgi:predicted transcriptional regulator